MKRILLVLLIVVFTLFSCKTHRFSDTHWIAVKSSPIPLETGNNVYDGLTIHFKNNKAILSNVYETYSIEFPINVDKNKIFLNDTLLGTTVTEYKDSIFIDIKESARVKFVKLDKQHAIEEKEQLWKHKDWILSNNNYVRNLYLKDTVFADWSDLRICLQKDVTNNRMVNRFDKWEILSINDNQLFVKTFRQFEDEFYRIKSYDGDSIIQLESLRYPEVVVTMTKRPYIDSAEKQNIISKIQNTHWKMSSIIKLDSISESFKGWKNKITKFKSLIDKKVSFKFSEDSSYQIYESDTIVSKGTWKLSPTGKEIILNKGISPSDYISLIQMHSDSITIGHLENFRALDEYSGLNIQEMYYVVTLTKQ
ncbi:hypothetical protein GCM10011344_34890 [Dokdonia pacifica]|uniref:Lipoprotein n=1 Tax=Dokdonia pacifica TaxID=1627892 RepID=A0A239APE2_9FLAO|nr:hypothetical protein [Dokdonia pacifica]GGG30996.1 hypothetical protein GCM10011344_34890 [Dokdonia pacifica]SNR97211.1 hypothetical protein SAMN06265376_10535 [Dokdonia pacifica]